MPQCASGIPRGQRVEYVALLVVSVGERPWFGPAPAWPHLRTGAGISIQDGKAHIPIKMDTITREAGGECARVIAILRGKKAYLEETYHVGSIGIFGSCRRGEEHEGSDVDILVEFSEVPGIFGFLRLERYLSELLGKKVDLVEKSALKPRIGRRVLQEVIYI